MQFYLTDLQTLLSCTQCNQVENLHIQHSTFQLIVNKAQGIINSDSMSKAINQTTISNTVANNTQHKKTAPQHQPNKQYHASQENSQDHFTITAPMTGTFYRSPAPQAPHFIKINDKINPGQMVGIIEAMKLMNEIESEFEGRVVEIFVQDRGTVTRGQELIKIQKIPNNS